MKELRETQRGSIQTMVGLFSSSADDEGMDPAVAEMAESLAWGFVGSATLMDFAWQGFGDLGRADHGPR